MTLSSYASSLKFGKSINLKVLCARKQGPKQDSLNKSRPHNMPEE